MKRSLIILSVLTLVAHLPSAAAINVAYHGIAPGKDVTLEVNQLIVSLKGQKDLTLYFPKGHYEFYPENAVEAYRAVTNHDNSLKRETFSPVSL